MPIWPPYIFSDVHGNYKGPDGEIHTVGKAKQYTVFSLWDTFRALHPLFTITQKNRVNDMINSFIRHYEVYGLLPNWELMGNESHCMIGNHAIPVITEAYLKGIRDFDVEKAYEAMKATSLSKGNGLDFFRSYNYIPADLEKESVSKTLEYAYDDWCMAQMAKALNKEDDYLYFMESSKNYKNVFDPSTGLMRAKLSDGTWKTPFSPFASTHRADDYTEGNAWQYSWFVPHDIEGLITLQGGKTAFTNKLDSLFTLPSIIEGTNASPDISGLIGQYAQGNEPSHHVVYLFNYTDQPPQNSILRGQNSTRTLHGSSRRPLWQRGLRSNVRLVCFLCPRFLSRKSQRWEIPVGYTDVQKSYYQTGAGSKVYH